MSIDFNVALCQTQSNKKTFGLCDNPHPAKDPAYIAETDGARWIAVVENEDKYLATFTAIDHCIEMKRPDGAMDQRCDGMLTYNTTVIFVELKERGADGNGWVKDAEPQLRATISRFQATEEQEKFANKKAYIANSAHPKFKMTQMGRMNRFLHDTGYVLRIVNRIILD